MSTIAKRSSRKKMLSKPLIQFICTLFTLQLVSCGPIPANEEAAQLSSHLRFFAQRFRKILPNVDSKFEAELQSLLKRYEAAAAAADPKREYQALDDYEATLSAGFAAYLNQQLDHQYLNEEILIEEWYLRRLSTQVSASLGAEIAELLPRYRQAVQLADIDEKYDAFASVQEQFSENLLAFLDKAPADVALLNVQLQFFDEFLLYLAAEATAREFELDIKNLRADLQQALSGESAEEKLSVLTRFDDFDTKFGRFLDYKMIEFEFESFSA